MEGLSLLRHLVLAGDARRGMCGGASAAFALLQQLSELVVAQAV